MKRISFLLLVLLAVPVFAAPVAQIEDSFDSAQASLQVWNVVTGPPTISGGSALFDTAAVDDGTVLIASRNVIETTADITATLQMQDFSGEGQFGLVMASIQPVDWQARLERTHIPGGPENIRFVIECRGTVDTVRDVSVAPEVTGAQMRMVFYAAENVLEVQYNTGSGWVTFANNINHALIRPRYIRFGIKAVSVPGTDVSARAANFLAVSGDVEPEEPLQTDTATWYARQYQSAVLSGDDASSYWTDLIAHCRDNGAQLPTISVDVLMRDINPRTATAQDVQDYYDRLREALLMAGENDSARVVTQMAKVRHLYPDVR